MELRRLCKDDYDQWLALLNGVFSRKNNRDQDFEKELPKMCVRDDKHMGMHLGIFEDGKLVACLGVYPLETVVAGEKLLFSTTGNVATHWEYEGRGYMSRLMDAAMEEWERLDVDASRLGGKRRRYNRYGFESSGQNYMFSFPKDYLAPHYTDGEKAISFKRVGRDDTAALEYMKNLYNRGAVAVPRNDETNYNTLVAWMNVPWLALEGDTPIGYLNVNEAGTWFAECFTDRAEDMPRMLTAWQMQKQVGMTVFLPPHMVEEIRLLIPMCEMFNMSSPSHFMIRNWDKVVGAYMKLKATYTPMAAGRLCLGIEGYGAILIECDGTKTSCRKTDEKPDITLDRLAAVRYIFGPYPAACAGPSHPMADSWFPLPLGWNGQDRV